MKKNKIIIFDFDGVVVSSCRMGFEINKELITDLEYIEIQRWGEGNIYQAKLRDGVDTVQQNEYYFREYSQRVMELAPMDGIKEVLKDIDELGYSIVIVSSSSKNSIEDFLKKYDLEKCFMEIMGKEVGDGKAKKIRMVLEKYKINPKETLMVTDTVGDVKEAKEVGLKTIGTIWGLHEAERLKQNGADFVAEKPEDILIGLKKLLALN